MIRLTIYAGPGVDDGTLNTYEPSVDVRMVDERDLANELHKLGLEWRQADYFPGRQTVLVLDPVPEQDDRAEVQAKVRAAAEALEGTGLL
jgi:hypothetical protein